MTRPHDKHETTPQTFYVVREGSTEADGARKLGAAYKFILECLAKKDAARDEAKKPA